MPKMLKKSLFKQKIKWPKRVEIKAPQVKTARIIAIEKYYF
jgi:hypothetical protein